MTKVTIEKNNLHFKKGDIVEYPDGAVVLVTDWESETRNPNHFEGVVLQNEQRGSIPIYFLGETSTMWRKIVCDHCDGYNGSVKRFVGRVVLEQTEEDDE